MINHFEGDNFSCSGDVVADNKVVAVKVGDTRPNCQVFSNGYIFFLFQRWKEMKKSRLQANVKEFCEL